MARSLHGVVLLLLVAACGGGAESWREPRPGDAGAAAMEFAPSVKAARRYNDPADRRASDCAPLMRPIGDATRRAAEATGSRVPQVDGRLCAVAAELARLAGTHGPPPYAAVAFVMQHRGVIEPSPHLIVVQGGPDAAASVASELEPRLRDLLPRTRFARMGAGSARSGDREVYVMALQESHIETDPIPRRAGRGDTIVVKGRLLEPFGEPTVLVTGDDGKVSRQAVVKASNREFWARIPCGSKPSTQQVEVVGHDTGGATVLANFPVYCGRAPPQAIALSDPRADDGTGGDPRRVEARLFAMVNESRAKAGLPALTWSDDAARVARLHGEDMRENGFVGHISPTTGSAQDRARRGGIVTPVVLENVARAYSANEAHVGLMESPGHRANILSAEATHVGIGVVAGEGASDRPELYVTQVFFQIPRKVKVPEARAAVTTALDGQRRQAGQPALARDAELERIAQRLAERLARGHDATAAQAQADADTAKLARRYGSVVTVRSVTGDPATIRSDAVTAPTTIAVGIGIAQGNHPDVGKNAIWVILLLARSR